MKLIKKFIAYLSICSVVTTTVGCNEVIQSSMLDINSIPHSAFVKGTLSYELGQEYNAGQYVHLVAPAKNIRITARISNASLSPSDSVKGNTIYETFTDENGTYTLELPTVSTGADVVIQAENFSGQYKKVDSVIGGAAQYSYENVNYTLDEQKIKIFPNDVKLIDGTYAANGKVSNNPYKYNLAYTVVVGQNISKMEYDASTSAYDQKKDFIPAKGVDVIIKVVVPNQETMLYGTATNHLGKATFIIPSKTQELSTDVYIDVMSYEGKDFEYYKKETDPTLGSSVVNKYVITKGIYKQADKKEKQAVSLNSFDSQDNTVTKVKVVFHPDENVESYGYSASDWDSVSF